MPCSRKILTILGCAALACGASAAPREDATKKAKSDFLKKQDDKKGETKKESAKLPSKKAAESKPAKSTSAPSDAKAPAEAPGEPSKAEAATTPLPKLSVPLPVGQDSIDVTIPYKDTGTGKKTMNFKIGVGTRVDEDHLKMKNLQIETFDDSGVSEMTIALPGSILDLNTRTISGEEGVTIQRSDFQLTGKRMTFNTETRQGWVKGDVKMIIYDLSEQTDTAAPKKKEQGS
jgi:hypothetical protein